VKTRANPFKPNSEIAAVIKSIPIEKIFEDTTVAPPQDIWQELNPPKAAKEVVNADEAGEGPAIPPMRVSGFIEGNQLSAILQIGSPPSARYEQAVPGKTFTYGPNTYRVDRIEQGRVILVNRWEQGEKKGIQRIEVTLAGSSGRS
jgi:hypothetical protein